MKGSQVGYFVPVWNQSNEGKKNEEGIKEDETRKK